MKKYTDIGAGKNPNFELRYISSYHVHSKHSDGKNSVEEIITHAKKLGLDELGFSDHFFLPPSSCKIKAPSVESVEKYVLEISKHINSSNPIIRLGLEVDFFPETVYEVNKLLIQYPFDYLIGSVHVVDDIIIDGSCHNISSRFCTDIMHDYWILIRKMAESRVFDIVGHLDVMKKFGLYPTIDLSKEITLALKAIKEADMAIELNTSGWYFPCKEQYPSLDLIKKCKELDIPILVSADAHYADHLIRGFDEAYKLLEELNYSKTIGYAKRKKIFRKK